MASIELSQVSKRYPNGFLALHPCDLAVEPGEFIAVMGPSGAGKSTLIRTINGLESVSSGQVRVGGQTLDRRSARAIRARVGMVFQQFNLVHRLSVMTNGLAGRLAHYETDRPELVPLVRRLLAYRLLRHGRLLLRAGDGARAAERFREAARLRPSSRLTAWRYRLTVR